MLAPYGRNRTNSGKKCCFFNFTSKSEDTTNAVIVILIVVVVHIAVGRSDVPGVIVIVLGRRPAAQS